MHRRLMNPIFLLIDVRDVSLRLRKATFRVLTQYKSNFSASRQRKLRFRCKGMNFAGVADDKVRTTDLGALRYHNFACLLS